MSLYFGCDFNLPETTQVVVLKVFRQRSFTFQEDISLQIPLSLFHQYEATSLAPVQNVKSTAHSPHDNLFRRLNTAYYAQCSPNVTSCDSLKLVMVYAICMH